MLKTRKFATKKLVAAASSLALVGGLAVAAPAAAIGPNDEQLENATLTWKISSYAYVGHLGQLNNDPENVSGNVVKTDTDGWEFSQGTGIRNTETGDITVNYSGTVTLGNQNQGGYRIKISNPTVSTSGNTGQLTADVKFGLSRNGVNASSGHVFSTVQRLKVADLENVDFDGDALTAQSPTPADPTTGYSAAAPGFAGFTPEFTDFLNTAPDLRDESNQPLPSAQKLGNFFLYTSGTSAANINTNISKQAQPIAATYEVAPEVKVWEPKLELIGANGIPVNKVKTVTVKGSGFDPALRTAGLYVTFGPNAETIDKQDISNADAFYDAVPLFGAFPNDDGEFQTTVKVTGIYKSNQGKTYDGRKTNLGVSVWAAHTDTVASYRKFTKINFALGAVSYSKPGKVAKLKRGKTTKRTAKVTWKAPARTSVEFRDNKATSYQVRRTNNKGKTYGKWVTVTSRSFTFKKLKKGNYKFQVRAVGKGGASGVTTLKYKKK